MKKEARLIKKEEALKKKGKTLSTKDQEKMDIIKKKRERIRSGDLLDESGLDSLRDDDDDDDSGGSSISETSSASSSISSTISSSDSSSRRGSFLKKASTVEVPQEGTESDPNVIRLSFQFANGILTVGVIECRNLAAMDSCGTSDPFVTVSVGQKREKTEKKMKELNPVYNSTFLFPGLPPSEPQTVSIKVLDYDTVGTNEYIGGLAIEINPEEYATAKTAWYRLSQKKFTTRTLSSRSPKPSIKKTSTAVASAVDTLVKIKDRIPIINLAVTYVPPTKVGTSVCDGILTVLVKNCRYLPSKGADGLCDPYVVLTWGESQKEKTRILKKTANPEFHTDFQFRTTGDGGKLHMEVWDWDRIGTDELIGTASMGISDLKPYPELNSICLDIISAKPKDKSTSRRSGNFSSTSGRVATTLLTGPGPVNQEDIFIEKYNKLVHVCASQQKSQQTEMEMAKKLETLRRTEVRTATTEKVVHSNEDIHIVYFFAFLLLVALWNLVFSHFVGSLWDSLDIFSSFPEASSTIEFSPS